MSLNLRDQLEEKEKQFNGKDDIFGITGLTNSGYISSSRSMMFTSAIRHFVTLNNPEYPKVFMGMENVVGSHSTGYYRAKDDLIVVNKIPRFPDINKDYLYTLIVYDEKKDYYDIIIKKNVESLMETFGFKYNTKAMDKLKEGDKIKKDKVLYQSTSYDDDMNYGYGINATAMYTIENNTIEDAINISSSFAKKALSTSVDVCKISLNDNDILCDLYGKGDEYKCFPDIGEEVKNKTVCARRRIRNNQILFDLKKTNLRNINYNNDTLFYSEGVLEDIHIFSNKTIDDIEDNQFNSQILKYLKMQEEYYENLYEACKAVIDSGSKYSDDIIFYYKKANDILDPNVLWKEENGNIFSNIVIELTFSENKPISVGQKLTGRQGNKGVVGKIIPDNEMPFLANGKRVDVILNVLGVPNRLNTMQLFEQSINFICNTVVEKILTIDSYEERWNILHDIIQRFNKREAKDLKSYYTKLSTQKKDIFYNELRHHGVYINNIPMWEEKPLFDIISEIYDDYEWIKPIDVYINKFGRNIKILKPLIIGEIYFMKLKQDSKKGFSARSMGALNRKELPDKSYKSKNNQDLYSTTPIRDGYQELDRSIIYIPHEYTSKLHLLYRSSVIARRELGRQLLTNLEPIDKFEMTPEMKNINIEILKVMFKSMGVEIYTEQEKMKIKIYTGEIESFDTDDKYFIGTLDEYENYMIRKRIENKYKNEICVIDTREELERIMEEEYQFEVKNKNKYVIEI